MLSSYGCHQTFYIIMVPEYNLSLLENRKTQYYALCLKKIKLEVILEKNMEIISEFKKIEDC